MRHRDYIFDRSTSRKSRLIPSDYMRRLTEALDDLPEAEDAENETKVRVIEHSYNKSFAALISAAAVCILAVTGGFLASRPSEIISGGPGNKPADVPVTSSEKHDEVKPVVSDAAVTSQITVTKVPAVTTMTVTVSQKPAVTTVSESKIQNSSVPDTAPEDSSHDVNDQPQRPEPDPQEPPKEERPVVSSEREQQRPEEQKPEEQKPEENSNPEKPDPEKLTPEKPGPEKPTPEKPSPEKENPDTPNNNDKNHNANPAPPVKSADDAEFFRPDNVFAPEGPKHEIKSAEEHDMLHHTDDDGHEENISGQLQDKQDTEIK